MNAIVREIESAGNESSTHLGKKAALEILSQANSKSDRLGYAGDLTPKQAWQLHTSGVAEIIDVRTKRELQRVGYVASSINIEWLRDQDMKPNTHFLSELQGEAGKDAVLLFLCRSGKRSVAAAQAATFAGYLQAFNVLEGFEGDGNPATGWIKHNLPRVKA